MISELKSVGISNLYQLYLNLRFNKVLGYSFVEFPNTLVPIATKGESKLFKSGEVAKFFEPLADWIKEKKGLNLDQILKAPYRLESRSLAVFLQKVAEWEKGDWKGFVTNLIKPVSTWEYKDEFWFAMMDPLSDNPSWFVACVKKKGSNKVLVKNFDLAAIEERLQRRFGLEVLDSDAPYNPRIDYLIEQLYR